MTDGEGSLSERFWVVGVCHPGVPLPDDDIDMCGGFTSDEVKQINAEGMPMLVEHAGGPVGKWSHAYNTKSGARTVVGYVDLSTEEGRKAREAIRGGELRELSLAHWGGAVRVTEDSVLAMKVPMEISLVSQGARRGTKIVLASDQETVNTTLQNYIKRMGDSEAISAADKPKISLYNLLEAFLRDSSSPEEMSTEATASPAPAPAATPAPAAAPATPAAATPAATPEKIKSLLDSKMDAASFAKLLKEHAHELEPMELVELNAGLAEKHAAREAELVEERKARAELEAKLRLVEGERDQSKSREKQVEESLRHQVEESGKLLLSQMVGAIDDDTQKGFQQSFAKMMTGQGLEGLQEQNRVFQTLVRASSKVFEENRELKSWAAANRGSKRSAEGDAEGGSEGFRKMQKKAEAAASARAAVNPMLANNVETPPQRFKKEEPKAAPAPAPSASPAFNAMQEKANQFIAQSKKPQYMNASMMHSLAQRAISGNFE